ncbi:MAG: histidine kinase [Bacteroidota bacterium]
MKIYFALAALFIAFNLSPAQKLDLSERTLPILFDSLLAQTKDQKMQVIIERIELIEGSGLEHFPEWQVQFLQVKSELLMGIAEVDSAMTVANKAAYIAKTYHFQKLIAVNNHLIGNLFLRQKKYKEAIPYLEQAETYFRAEKKLADLSNCVSKLACALSMSSKSKEAQEVAEEALDIIEEVDNIPLKIQVLNDVSTVYAMLNDRLNAIRMLLKAHEIAKEYGFTKPLTGVSNNLAVNFFELRQFEKAKRYTQEVISICEELNLDYVKHHVLLNLSNIFLVTHSLDSAKYWLSILEAESSYQRNDLLKTEVALLHSELAFEEQQHEKAYQYLLSAKRMAEQTGVELNRLAAMAGMAKYLELKNKNTEALNLLDSVINHPLAPLFELEEPLKIQAKIYKKLKNYQSALAVQEQSEIIKDSLAALKRIGIIASLEADYQLKNKEEKIERLELENDLVQQKNLQNRRAISGLGITLLLAIGLGYYFSRHRKLKLEQSLAEVKENLLRLQINPHFIFNTLNSIQSSFLREDEEKTIHLFSRFSNLMRQVLHNSESAFVPLSEELDLIINYLELEKIRSNDKFDYKIEIEDQVNLYHAKVPSMILQIFIENSIWHGISPKQERGLIRIAVTEENGKSKITIEDDGVGRSFSILHKSKGQKSKKSLGTKLAMQRIQQLNRKFGKNLKLEVGDRLESSGTKVSMVA